MSKTPQGEAAVEIVAYEPQWPLKIEAERLSLQSLIAPWLAGSIEHVGSTAIPGIPAKPVIDIMAVLTLAGGPGAASLAGCKHMANDRGAPQHVSFPTQDGGKVYAHLYGSGKHGVLLAHGGRFNKESWTNQARVLAKAGFQVLAIDFRGGQSRAPSNRAVDGDRRFDVLAAVRYLRSTGATTVSVIGASMGGDYAAEAAESEPQAIDRLVLLAASGPKNFIVLEGSAHAQHLFQTDQGDRVMREILHFLSAP